MMCYVKIFSRKKNINRNGNPATKFGFIKTESIFVLRSINLSFGSEIISNLRGRAFSNQCNNFDHNKFKDIRSRINKGNLKEMGVYIKKIGVYIKKKLLDQSFIFSKANYMSDLCDLYEIEGNSFFHLFSLSFDSLALHFT